LLIKLKRSQFRCCCIFDSATIPTSWVSTVWSHDKRWTNKSENVNGYDSHSVSKCHQHFRSSSICRKTRWRNDRYNIIIVA